MLARTPHKGLKAMAVIVNRKARHEYEILETFEAGIVLSGAEARALREGAANIADAYCLIRNGEAWIVNMYIAPYKPAAHNNPDDPRRMRKLLLKKREIHRLAGKLKEKGLALVPLRLYFNARGWAKLEIALARGRRKHDKRQAIKEREIRRELDRRYKMRG